MQYHVQIVETTTRPFGDEDPEDTRTWEYAVNPPSGPQGGIDHAAAAGLVDTPIHTGESYTVYLDPLGSFYAALVGDRPEVEPVKLFSNRWVAVGPYWVQVRPLYKGKRRWDDVLAQRMPFWMRWRNKWLKRTCGTCLYFDRKGAEDWRHMITHQFADNESACMNEDILRQTLADYGCPEFPRANFGYCPRRDQGLAASLTACDEWRKAVAVAAPSGVWEVGKGTKEGKRG